MIIQNGQNGNTAKVDGNNQLHTLATALAAKERAVEVGNAYNINTGSIALTSSSDSAVLYFKNNESPVNGESGFFVSTIVIGVDDSGTVSGDGTVTLIRNPSAGTIVSGATAVDMNVNRNFGSSATLSSLAYKGAEGNTLTDGDDSAIFFVGAGTRSVFNIDLEVPKGSSLGIKINTKTTSGTTNVYVALIGYRIDGKNEIR